MINFREDRIMAITGIGNNCGSAYGNTYRAQSGEAAEKAKTARNPAADDVSNYKSEAKRS